MPSVTFEIEGAEQLNEALKIAEAKFVRAAAAALYQMGLKTIAIAIRLTPVDTGRLRASNYCAPPAVDPNGVMTCEVGFGAAYGIYVHERTDLRHRAPTQAKFLEHALDVISEDYMVEIAKRTAKNFADGVGVDAIASDVPREPHDGEIALAHRKAHEENRRRDRAKRKKELLGHIKGWEPGQ